MKRLDLAISLVVLALVSVPAGAQTGPAPTGAMKSTDAKSTDERTNGPFVLNEVVVTATRRSERLLDVPLSVTAFSQRS
jgi:iron complex outermembrane receptor protein